MKEAVIILGPTGVGKTELSVRLAKELSGEIISVDSVQIYKDLNIGSAKVSEAEKQGVEHHLIDLLEAEQNFSVHDFVELTKVKLKEIESRGNFPIIVGGTGLYVKALVLGYDLGQSEKNEEFREELKDEIEKNGLGSLYVKLCELDSERASKISANDEKRIIRGLEICKFGKTPTTQISEDIKYYIFALNIDREILYQRINMRVDIMVKNGLLKEVESLFARGLENAQSMKAIGYKEFVSYLKGEIGFDKAVELIKQHSRNYAKRQLTFLRGMENINYIDTTDKQSALLEMLSVIRRDNGNFRN